jgi:hypothetical protein
MGNPALRCGRTANVFTAHAALVSLVLLEEYRIALHCIASRGDDGPPGDGDITTTTTSMQRQTVQLSRGGEVIDSRTTGMFKNNSVLAAPPGPGRSPRSAS